MYAMQRGSGPRCVTPVAEGSWKQDGGGLLAEFGVPFEGAGHLKSVQKFLQLHVHVKRFVSFVGGRVHGFGQVSLASSE